MHGGMKLLRDTWLVFGRYWYLFIHNPVWVVIGVVQPVLYLVLFAPLVLVAHELEIFFRPNQIAQPIENDGVVVGKHDTGFCHAADL